MSAINPIIPVAEERGQIARSVLLQGIGVGLPDLDLLVFVCKSIGLSQSSKEQMRTRSLIQRCVIEKFHFFFLSWISPQFSSIEHLPVKQHEKKNLSNVKSSQM